MSWGVEVLLERLPTAKRSVALNTVENVGWGVEVLV
jgi:hypothetical protein